MKFVKLGSANHEEEVESEGTWAVSYGDMITLLLSFFVIFFTTDFDKKKQEDMNQHMMEELTSIDAMALQKTKEMVSKLMGPAMTGGKDDHTGVGKGGESAATGSGVGGAISAAGVIGDKGSEKGEGYKVEVIPWQKNLIVKFSNISFFKSGSTDLTKEAEKALSDFSEKYIPYSGAYRLSVKGFTDRKAIIQRKNQIRFKDNLELSALRAVSAMRFLKKTGIPLTSMDIAGYGELKKIHNYLKDHESLDSNMKDSLSRTIVMIIKPEKEESFL
jgi:flagellar motor protein MotB